MTTFIGLQSLGYPSLEPSTAIIPEQEDALMNASMMYAHGVSWIICRIKLSNIKVGVHFRAKRLKLFNVF